MDYCTIDGFEKPKNEDDMWEVTLRIDDHHSAVHVYGADFDEAVSRAVIIRYAFNNNRSKQ